MLVEKWQQWFPFHINRFRGSQKVQAMHPAARSGFLYLLASSWQSEDCTISSDPLDLSTESGLGDELWEKYGPRILRMFSVVDNRLRNEVLYEEWLDAREVFHRRRAGAERTNTARSPNAQRTQSERQADTVTKTGTGTETKGKTFVSHDDADLDPIYRAYPRKVAPAKALAAIRKAVTHLETGKDVPAMERPDAIRFLIAMVQRFAQSPAGQQGEFTPHPATWFNAMRYLDDSAEWDKRGDGNGAHKGVSGNRGQRRVDGALDALRRADEADRGRDATEADTAMAGGAWCGEEGGDGGSGAAGVFKSA